MSRKKWVTAKLDKELASRISSQFDIDPFAALLLVSRGITDEADIEDFFTDDYFFCDPFELKDMDKAVRRIEQVLENGEKIAVYGDYDADGVTSTAVLYHFFEMLGANVTYYIPDRNEEGYGLNKQAIKKLCENGVNLIITVDNGISAIEEAEYIKQLGMELVVTDHHKAGSVLPQACAVVDAHRTDCPSSYKDWSGVGIAFKLICALSDGEYEDALDNFSDIIAIGTIGDIVPLTGENRAIVRHGLRKINAGSNIGIDALKSACGQADKKLTSTSVAFTLVPRINAIGRIQKAEEAFRLLISDDINEALSIAQTVDDANAQRQHYEQLIVAEAEKQLAERPKMIYDRVLVFDGLDWHGGVIGIVAARFVERFGKPCIVITSDGEEAKGSARSIEGFSLYDAISSCSSMLTRFGGHTLAAGFSLKSCDIENFRKAVNDYAKTVEMPFAKVNIDCKLRPEFISADILPVIESLEPFGAENPQPTFGLFAMKLTSIQPIGNGKHLRLGFTRNNTSLTALKFGMTAEEFPYIPGDTLDLAVRLEKNEYKGQVRVSIYIKDIRMSGTDDDKYLNCVRLYEKIKRGERVLQSEALQALPSRKFVAELFRFVRDSGGFGFDSDILCYRLSDDGSSACKALMSIDILCELGIFEKDGNKIKLTENTAKVNLDDSKLMAYLKKLAE